jgi:hypothetical protein
MSEDAPRKLTLKKPGESAAPPPPPPGIDEPPAPATPAPGTEPDASMLPVTPRAAGDVEPRKLNLAPPGGAAPAAEPAAAEPRKLSLAPSGGAPAAAPVAAPAAAPVAAPAPPSAEPRKLSLAASPAPAAAPVALPPGIEPDGAPASVPGLVAEDGSTAMPAAEEAPDDDAPPEPGNAPMPEADGDGTAAITLPRKKRNSDNKKVYMIAGGAAAGVVLLILGLFMFKMLMDAGDAQEDGSAAAEAPVNDTPAGGEAAAPEGGSEGGEAAAEEIAKGWGIKVTPAAALMVSDAEAFAGVDDAFTIDYWARTRAPESVRRLVLAGDAEDGSFALGTDEDEEGKAVFVFSLPDLPSPAVPAPQHDGWSHIAGVYTGGDDGQLMLFFNGSLVSSKAAGASVKVENLVGLQFLLDSDDEETTALVDQVRISKTARYTGHFQPTREFEPDDDTASLIPIEKVEEGGLTDVVRETSVDLPEDAEWVNIQKSLKRRAPLEIPYHLLLEFGREMGPEAVTQLQSQWSELSGKERRKLLAEWRLQ